MPNNPPTLAVLLADIQRRLRRLETPQLLAVADYRIYQNGAGELVAQHVPSGTVAVILTPPP